MKGGTRKRGKSWSYYFDAAMVDGKRKKIEKGGFRTKKEAEAALAKAISEYDSAGSVFEPSSISVADYLDFWFENYCMHNLAENTQRDYKSKMENHLKPRFGSYRLRALQTAPIQEFVNEIKLNGFAISHVKGILSTFSAALDYAVEPLQYIRYNPCDRVKVGKGGKPARERIVLTDDQFRTIIQRFPAGSRFHIALMLGWNCGIRISECMALTWDDIDMDARTISVTKQLVKRVDNGISFWAFKEPKYNSAREIIFGETLYQALKAEKKRQSENELKYGEYYAVQFTRSFYDEKGQPRERVVEMQKGVASGVHRIRMVCTDENGEMTTSDSFKYCSRVIHHQLGLSFDYHSLRHTHATKLVEAGANIKAVQVRLGHKNIETTMNTYVHHTDSMGQDAADLFEAVANGLPPK